MSQDVQSILIAGGRVYDDAGDTDRPARADILIQGDCIAAVEPGLSERLADNGAVPRLSRTVTVDESKLRQEIEGLMEHLAAQISSVSGCTEALRPQLAEAHQRTWEAPQEVRRYVGSMTAE